MKRFAVLAEDVADLLGVSLSVPEEKAQVLDVMERSIRREMAHFSQSGPEGKETDMPQIARGDE